MMEVRTLFGGRAELLVQEHESSHKATKPWFVSIRIPGEEHLIVVPYERYAKLLLEALTCMDPRDIEDMLHGKHPQHTTWIRP